MNECACAARAASSISGSLEPGLPGNVLANRGGKEHCLLEDGADLFAK